MQAMIMMLFAPVIPLLCGLQYRKAQKTGEVIFRYVIYTLIMTAISAVIMMVMGSEGISFTEKLDMSPAFALKYVLMELILAGVIAGGEWLYVGKKVVVQVDWERYKQLWVVRFWKKYICPVLIYILAALIVCLNVSLMFDNVLWGDEAFSANTAQKTMGGILQVMYYWDSHPPLYYYWLKLFGEVFGHVGVIYHLASIVPFLGGVVLALTVFRKHFGKIPAAFFLVISGLGKACLQYNLEIRMYALAFLCITLCFYCSYRVISASKKGAWIGMVLFGLAGAYTHYYALFTAGMILFFTGVAVWIKHRGKSWLKGLCAVVVYVVGYTPWLTFVFAAMERGASNWWITDILGVSQCLDMIMGGEGMKEITLPLVVVILVAGLAVESGIFGLSPLRTKEKDCSKLLIQIHTPSTAAWSDKTYAMLVGAATIVGTLAAGYVISILFRPMLVARYLYPLSAVTFIMLVIGSGMIIEWAEKASKSGTNAGACEECAETDSEIVEKGIRKYLVFVVKLIFILMILMLLAIGLKIYKADSAPVKDEKAKTEAVLNLIGEPEEDVKMVVTGVKHLTWTVLYYYFPENEVVAGTFREADADKFWYFTANYLTEEEMKEMSDQGYLIYGYGDMQISQYPFVLYYFEKE